jgi:hypothetical protein
MLSPDPLLYREKTPYRYTFVVFLLDKRCFYQHFKLSTKQFWSEAAK